MPAHWSRRDALDLAYLACLTRAGLKPLSRWEKPVAPEWLGHLRRLGLQSREVRRALRSGAAVQEIVFSPSAERSEEYAASFEGASLEPTPARMRLEGRLFGYPECCVESFVTRGYARNSLRRSEQRLLFHWACPGCRVTPGLLPQYRRIYRESRRWVRTSVLAPSRFVGPRLRRALAAAASLALLGVPPAAFAGPGDSLDPHCLLLPIDRDADQDLLSAEEERLLDGNPAVSDQDQNGVLDGVDLAKALSWSIDALPTQSSTDQTHLVAHLAFGLETCAVCGASINMGFLEIIQPLEEQVIAVPCIAKHFLEHGSFTYQGSVHEGRLNVALLYALLKRPPPIHLLLEPASSDADADGLCDDEEAAFGSHVESADTDGDQLVDGVDLARELRSQLDSLPKFSPETAPKDRPHIIEYPMDGVETCPRCGEPVTMNLLDVVDPVGGTSLRISSMALHHLEHGGFRWQGGQLEGGAGRVDPRQLRAVLNGDGHRRPVGIDPDGDLLTDAEEDELGRGRASPDENGNQVVDGVDLAREAALRIEQLPTQPDPTKVYRLDLLLRGLERCGVCGAEVNMGHLTVCNPKAELYCRLPYLALHFLEHGSLGFAGDVHEEDRLDVGLLLNILGAPGPAHRQALAGETDEDGLSDAEEELLDTDPTKTDTTEPPDGVPDGFDLVRGFWRALTSLPPTPDAGAYVVQHPARGLVSCAVCGEDVNMGFLELITPRQAPALRISYLQLHFLKHGSLAGPGTERVDPVDLRNRLRPAVGLRLAGQRPQLRWIGTDGGHYQVQTAGDPAGPWTPGPVFVGQGCLLLLTDSELAPGSRRFYCLQVW